MKHFSWIFAGTMLSSVSSFSAMGQAPSAPRPGSEQQPPAQPTTGRTTPSGQSATSGLAYAVQRRDEYRKGRTHIYMNDFGELGRYRAANARLKAAMGPATATSNRVVFFGDSITDAWNLETYFPGKHYVNRGIGGQTTSQMLVRFRQDVIDLAPKVVVILAGTNDIAGNAGPMSLEDTEENFASMAELARAHGIRVVFSSILPVHNYTPQSEAIFPLRPPEKILELNRWLKNACETGGHVYLDYFTTTVDEKGFLKRTLAEDGLHPNRAAYTQMAPLATAAIERALATPPRP